MSCREIKFRAWDTEKKIMFPSSTIFKINIGAYEDSCNLIVMQYTGKKDKNGIEIYEGDLVSDSCGIYYVFWSDSYCGWGIGDDKTEFYERMSKQGELKVIGNIYENQNEQKTMPQLQHNIHAKHR